MGTNGGDGVVDGVTLRRLQAILVPAGLKSQPGCKYFFSLIFVQIHTNEFIQLLSSSLGNRSIAGSYRYRSWQL